MGLGFKKEKGGGAQERGRTDERSWWIELHLRISQFGTVGTSCRELGIVCLNKCFFFFKATLTSL